MQIKKLRLEKGTRKVRRKDSQFFVKMDSQVYTDIKTSNLHCAVYVYVSFISIELFLKQQEKYFENKTTWRCQVVTRLIKIIKLGNVNC